MPSPRTRLGTVAEGLARKELERLGYRITEANYRTRCGEIDLVAWDSGTLVFVEVRCKRNTAFGSPAESIGSAKRGKLIATAERYLQERGCGEVDCRFDVVEVVAAGGRLVVREIIRDAFNN